MNKFFLLEQNRVLRRSLMRQVREISHHGHCPICEKKKKEKLESLNNLKQNVKDT